MNGFDHDSDEASGQRREVETKHSERRKQKNRVITTETFLRRTPAKESARAGSRRDVERPSSAQKSPVRNKKGHEPQGSKEICRLS